MDDDGQDQEPRPSLLYEIGGVGSSDNGGLSTDPQSGGWYSSGLFGRYPGELSVDGGFELPAKTPAAAPLNPIRWYDDGSDAMLPRNTGLASVGGLVDPGEASDPALSEASFALPGSPALAQSPADPHTQCPPGTIANRSGKPDLDGWATEYGVKDDGKTPTHFAGQPTANGSKFDPWGYTAAARAEPHGGWGIPKNSYVDVVSATDPNSHVVVKVTDTGPLGKNDVIDLSAAGMQQLTGKPYNRVPVNIYSCRPSPRSPSK